MHAVIRGREAVAGWLLLAAIISIGVNTLVPEIPGYGAAIGTWGAGLLLWPRLTTHAKRQAVVLLSIGLTGIGWGLTRQISPNLQIATTANATLLAMLGAVSFLRLITLPQTSADTPTSRGKSALWHNLFAVHLFGSVINLSAVFIMGDRMSGGRGLSDSQTLILSRGFAAAAFWSPFFAAMAAALTYAPGADLGRLLLMGIPLALISLLLTTLLCRVPEDFVGYPMQLNALALPAALAVSVLTLHQFHPQLSVLGIICVLAPVMTVLALGVRRFPVAGTLRQHIQQGLPGMHNELVLFLSAGVMASGLNSLFLGLDGWLPFQQFHATEAILTLVFMLATSLIGVHPVINIATLGTLYASLQPDATLLAMTFLCGWAIGVVNTPFSGLSLAMQGRYQIPALALTRLNGSYSLLLTAAAGLTLMAYEQFFLH